jgi:hypothetical protein
VFLARGAAAAKLAAKRERILADFEDGLIDKAARDVKLAAVADAESKPSTGRWVKRVTLPPDVERADAGRVSEYLRPPPRPSR